MGGWWRWALVSPDGVAPIRMVGVSASVIIPCTLLWHRLTRVVPESAVKRLWCVCVEVKLRKPVMESTAEYVGSKDTVLFSVAWLRYTRCWVLLLWLVVCRVLSTKVITFSPPCGWICIEVSRIAVKLWFHVQLLHAFILGSGRGYRCQSVCLWRRVKNVDWRRISGYYQSLRQQRRFHW